MMGIAQMALAASADFEVPNYQVGQDVDGREGWNGIEAMIADEQSAAGNQSLKIAGSVRRSIAETGKIRFIDLCLLPVFEKGEALATLHICGARLGFAKVGERGKVIVFSPNESAGRPIEKIDYVLSEDGGFADGWIRVTLRLDEARGRWDLFLDGKPAAVNVAMGERTEIFEVLGTSSDAVYLDAYEESENNPLFGDEDHDGLPDAEEEACGLNAYADDRDGDLDADGISNAEEIFGGTSPQAPGSLKSVEFLYVDNRTGNDANSGRHSYAAIGADGPKASLKAAMASARSGCVIVVLKGTGIYEEGSRGMPGKALTIKTVGPVTIR